MPSIEPATGANPEPLMGLSLIRCLDGIAYALMAQAVILLFPGFGRDILGVPHLLSLAPTVALAWFVWRLPPTGPPVPGWHNTVTRLRAFSLAQAGLLPFAVWLWLAPESGYLFLNATLGLAATVGVFFNLALLLRGLAGMVEQEELGVAAQLVRLLVIFLMLVPLSVGFLGVLFLQAAQGLAPGRAIAILLGTTHALWLPAAFLVLVPVCLTIVLCLSVRGALVTALRDGEVRP